MRNDSIIVLKLALLKILFFGFLIPLLPKVTIILSKIRYVVETWMGPHPFLERISYSHGKMKATFAIFTSTAPTMGK